MTGRMEQSKPTIFVLEKVDIMERVQWCAGRGLDWLMRLDICILRNCASKLLN